MGERTVREVLKRRSAETLRKIQVRRDRHKKIRGRRRGPGVFAWGVLLLLIAGLAWTGWLAWRAHTDFKAHQWTVPARVHARALELYPGSRLSQAALLAELRRLGYSHQTSTSQAGTYSVNGEQVQFVTRPFRFWDGDQPSLRVTAAFRGNQLSALKGANNEDLYLVRLEPPLIGSLFPASGEDRILVGKDEVPPALLDMLLAIEDRRFHEHFGVDLRSVARAFNANLAAGEITQGGSTITQQLVKNFYLTRERSFVRKANEAVMALVIDLSFEKDAILESYMNEVYLGQDGERAIHGFGLGSHFYFQKPLRELKPEEMALLVALIKGPSYYDPRRHPQRALDRRNHVLSVAAQLGALDPVAAQAAISEPLNVVEKPPQGTTYFPAFMQMLKQQLRRDYDEHDLTARGLIIFSTLDPEAQLSAERALSEGIAAIERDRRFAPASLEGAIVVTGIEGAEVKAVVGGREARFAGFNRALTATRPIGSLVKPVVYLAALQRSSEWTLASNVEDTPVEVVLPDRGLWKPGNYRNEYHGTVTVLDALAGSYNAAAVRVGMQVGVSRVISDMQKLGFARTPNAYPSLLLGAVSMAPVEVAQMYNTLATGGFRTPLNTIREVLRPDGTPLKRYALEVSETVDPRAVFLVNHALQDVTRRGTAAAAGRALSVRTAGKTGTTDDYRDSWFAGYSGDALAVVWVGRDGNESAQLTGATGALPIWTRLMQDIGKVDFRPARPGGMNETWVDMRGGKLATERCPTGRSLPFINGSEPTGQPGCGSLQERTRNIFQ